MLITILATAFVLGILIMVHELGHFWVARRAGIRVLTFSLGFGPKILGLRRGETIYKISAVPFGGYVKMAGEDAFDDGYQPQPGDYLAAPWWARVLMALAGPLANLMTAFLLLVLVGLIGVRTPDFEPLLGRVKEGSLAAKSGLQTGDRILKIENQEVRTWYHLSNLWSEKLVRGRTDSIEIVYGRGQEIRVVRLSAAAKEQFLSGLSPAIGPVLGEVMVGAPAYQAGLQKGDVVLEIEGQPVATWEDMRTIIYSSPGKEIALLVGRGRDTFSIKITPMPQKLPGQGVVGVIGISPPSYGSFVLKFSVLEAIVLGAANTVATTIRTYSFLAQIITEPKAVSKQLGGVVLIGQMAGQSAKKGLSDLLQLMAVLSISLFVLNLLPLPVLDGGVIFFSVLEGLRRRRLSMKVQAIIQQIGFSLLLMLVAYTLFNDFSRIISRHQALKDQPAIEQRED